MTGYGFCGPMTASGTTFDAKAEAATDTLPHAITGLSGMSGGGSIGCHKSNPFLLKPTRMPSIRPLPIPQLS